MKSKCRLWVRVVLPKLLGFLPLIFLTSDFCSRAFGDSPTASVTGTTNLCAGGSTFIQLELTGASPWTITWSDGAVQADITESRASREVHPTVTTTYSVASVVDGAGVEGRGNGEARIRVVQPPVILSQPQSSTVCAGLPATFTVRATSMAEENGLTAGAFGAAQTACCGAENLRLLRAEAAKLPQGLRASPLTVTSLGFEGPQGILPARIPGGMATNTILIKPKATKSIAAVGNGLAAKHAQLGVRVKRSFPHLGNLQVLNLPPGLAVQEAIRAYLESGLVDYAEPDYLVAAFKSPNDPYFLDGSLWGLNNMGQTGGTPHADVSAEAAWDTRTSADPVIVAVVDTGVWYDHEDLIGNMWTNPQVNAPVDGVVYADDVHGINAIDGTGDPRDDNFHGTHVAGTIGAVGNNGIGVVGVAWNVRIMACKFLGPEGYGFTSDAITCINYAVSKGAKVINNSWGSSDYSQALRDTLSAAQASNVLFVCAAGNFGADSDVAPFYPAGLAVELDNVIALAATDADDHVAGFSNFGAVSVALAAPGISIVSTLPVIATPAMQSRSLPNSYGGLSGTSMASPHVAGAAALVWAEHPEEGYLVTVQRLLSGTDPVPGLNGRTRTGGRLNVHNALTQSPQPAFWLAYQWRRNGKPLPGQTGANYALWSPALSDDGARFDVVVSNSCGVVVSETAVLSVKQPAAIQIQPKPVIQCETNSVVLSVSATGSEPITYGWRTDRRWGSAWRLDSNGLGEGGMFLGSSVTNGDGSVNPKTPTDIDTNGLAFGLSASGGRTTTVTRGIDPLLPGETLFLDIDNGFVEEGGAVGFALCNRLEEKIFEFYCTNNTYFLDFAGSPTPQPVGIPFTTHGITMWVDMFPDVVIIVSYAKDGTSSMLLPLPMPDQTQNPADHIVLFNNNAGESPAHDVYFNNFGGQTVYGSVSVRSDNARQPAYASGWLPGTDGGTGFVPGATNSSLTIKSCTTNDTGVYNVVVKNSCGAILSADAVVTVQTAPCRATTPPSNLSVALVSAKSIELSWNDNSDREAGFLIERSEDGASFTVIADVPAETTSFRDRGRRLATTYYYRVRAFNYLGASEASEPASITTADRFLTTVVGWGWNLFGQIETPGGLEDVVQIVAGYGFSAALSREGKVVVWGYFLNEASYVPAELPPLSVIAAGDFHCLGLGAEGFVRAWGANYDGRATVPPDLADVVAIAAGDDHSLAVRRDGTVAAWGDNVLGQTNIPADLSGVKAVAAGTHHSLALKKDGTVVGWGFNPLGQAAAPQGLANVVAIAAGFSHSAALTSNGEVVVWGNLRCIPPRNLRNVVAIAAGGYQTIALRGDGTVVVWGDNAYGQADVPVGLQEADAIASGGGHFLALVPQPVHLQAPSGLVSRATSAEEIELSWSDNSANESGFVIDCATDVGGVPGRWAQRVKVPIDVTNITVGALMPATRYWFRIRAVNDKTEQSFFSNQSSASTFVLPPLSPSGLVAQAENTESIRLNWIDNSLDESGFVLDRAFDNGTSHGPWVTVARLPPDTNNFLDEGLVPSAGYWYRVSAFNAAGDSAACDPVHALTMGPPVILLQPHGQTNAAGGQATLAVALRGSPPFNYQWRHDGIALSDSGNNSGSRSEILTFTNLMKADQGYYTVEVGNAFGSAASSEAFLFVIDPVIARQPTDLTNMVDSSVTFSVVASGSPPLSYRWQHDGIDLVDSDHALGAHEAILRLIGVSLADQGRYAVLVTNDFGSAVSRGAGLTICEPPRILSQPISHTVSKGSVGRLYVAAAGAPTPEFQWFFGTAPLPGAQQSSLEVSNFDSQNEGPYFVSVSNAFGAVLSSSAGLYLDWPIRFLQPGLNANGEFAARLVGLSNTNTVLEASDDCLSWFPLATNHMLQGIFDFADTNSPSSTNRLYRGLLLK